MDSSEKIMKQSSESPAAGGGELMGKEQDVQDFLKSKGIPFHLVDNDGFIRKKQGLSESGFKHLRTIGTSSPSELRLCQDTICQIRGDVKCILWERGGVAIFASSPQFHT
jgi:hypothetical protein